MPAKAWKCQEPEGKEISVTEAVILRKEKRPSLSFFSLLSAPLAPDVGEVKELYGEVAQAI